jgi:hypothetical protein
MPLKLIAATTCLILTISSGPEADDISMAGMLIALLALLAV